MSNVISFINYLNGALVKYYLLESAALVFPLAVYIYIYSYKLNI